jgi:hypothetical protein
LHHHAWSLVATLKKKKPINEKKKTQKGIDKIALFIYLFICGTGD